MPEIRSEVYDDIVPRIQNIYNSCSAAEQKQLLQILQEIADKGYSETLENVWLVDFKEVPVSIDRFICDSDYLGETNRNGAAVYPFWRTTCHDIFSQGNRYNEIVLSGATRIGKSSTMIVMLSYMLYRLMLYRNPHEYFQKKEVSRFTIAFANLTRELAEGVAYREFNDTIKASPWFMQHGKVSKSERNFYYIPEGDKIEIIAGSDAAHMLGKQIWACLVGSTLVNTPDGFRRIDQLAGETITVYQNDGPNHIKRHRPNRALAKLTRSVSNTIRIYLDSGDYIEGTYDHRLMLSNGKYVSLQSIGTSDELWCASEAHALHIIKKVRVRYCEPIPVYDILDVRPFHNFEIVCGNKVLISHNCAMDEVNFAKAGVKDISLAKAHMKNLYDTLMARISGTFRIGGEIYGKMVTASSKNTDSDFLSDHIETELNAGNQHLYLVDRPQWEILPKSMFSDKVFHFTVGDRYKRGFVIPEENDDEEHRHEYELQGYRVIEAPAELRTNFVADYDIALRDIAGISVTGAMGFITQEVLTLCHSQTRHNPFYEDIIVTGRNDGIAIEDYFHLEAVPNELKYQPMNIHLDMAETSDRSGISGTCVSGNKIIENEEGKRVLMPMFAHVFTVGIEAPRGDRQSFQKIVNFLLFLRNHGFNIGTISADQYQSSYVLEMLGQQGFKTAKVSVDRSMEPYIGLKNVLIDQRIDLVHNQLLEDELVNLKRLANKFDHDPDKSKDLSDSLCGSVWTLITEQVSPRPSTKSAFSAMAAANSGHSRAGNTPSAPSQSSFNRAKSRAGGIILPSFSGSLRR